MYPNGCVDLPWIFHGFGINPYTDPEKIKEFEDADENNDGELTGRELDQFRDGMINYTVFDNTAECSKEAKKELGILNYVGHGKSRLTSNFIKLRKIEQRNSVL